VCLAEQVPDDDHRRTMCGMTSAMDESFGVVVDHWRKAKTPAFWQNSFLVFHSEWASHSCPLPLTNPPAIAHPLIQPALIGCCCAIVVVPHGCSNGGPTYPGAGTNNFPLRGGKLTCVPHGRLCLHMLGLVLSWYVIEADSSCVVASGDGQAL
jgi:hypothetical protein